MEEQLASPGGNMANSTPLKLSDSETSTTINRTALKNTEEELQQSKDLLQNIINAIHIGIAVYKAVRNDKGEIIDFVHQYINRASFTMLGEDFTGKRLSDHGENGITQLQLFTQVIETGQRNDYVREINFRGNRVWFSITNTPLDSERLVHTWEDVTKRKQAEQEILNLKDEIAQKTTDKYESLFNSIDEGFEILELIYDETGKAVDFYYIETNPAFERQTGLINIKGKLGKEVSPNIEEHWFEAYDKVVKTGKPVRIENYNAFTQHWYESYASRVGDTGSRQLAIVFNDITKRKQREKQQEYLLQLNDALRPLADPIAVQQVAMQILGEHLKVDRVVYADINIDQDYFEVIDNYTNQSVQKIMGRFPFTAFGPPGEKLKKGENLVIDDVNAAVDDDDEKKAYFSIDVHAVVAVPLIKNGKLVADLSVHQAQPRKWNDYEVSLIQETAERTWAAIEKAKAEEALRKNEEKYRSLFESIDEGFAIVEVIPNEHGRITDMIWREANPGVERQAGISGWVGKRASEIVPHLEQRWLDAMTDVYQTGQAVRMEAYNADLDRWISTYYGRVGGAGSLFIAAIFNDITERKQKEQRQAFLLKFSDQLRTTSTPDEVANTALELLIAHLRLDRSYIVSYYLDENIALLDYQIGNDTVPPLPQTFDLSRYPEAYKAVLDQTLVIEDNFERQGLSADEQQNSARLGMRAMVAATLRKGENKPLWSMVAINSRPRRWTSDEVQLVEEVAERTWIAMERAKAEDALRRSEKRFQSIANLVPDLLWDSNPDGSTNWYNQRWLEYTGQHFEEAIGWGWIDAIHPDDREDSAKRYGEAVEASKPLRQEHRIRRHDGQYRWFVITTLPLRNENGRVIKMYGAATDIHDRRQAEELLRQRERELAKVQEIGKVGGVEIDVTNHLYGKRSPEYLRIHGLPPETISETHQDWLRRVHPEDREKAEQVLFNALESTNRSYESEYRIIRPSDGKVRWIYAKLDIQRNDDGKAVRLIGLHTDITRRRRAEEALRIAEERYRTALESAEMAAWDWNIVAGSVMWNKEHFTILGLASQASVQPVKPDFFLKFIHPEDTEQVRTALFEAVSTNGIYHAEFRIIRADSGEVRWMDGFGRVVDVAQGNAVRMVGVMSDVTERRNLLQQREEFIGIASHELKTPVTSIKAYAQVLEEMLEQAGDEQSIRLIRKLDAQVDRLTRLIQDLLDTTKIAEGQLSLHPEDFDIEILITENIDAWQRLSNQHRILWEPANSCRIHADKERISQVLTNFVSNAIKYAPEGGDVIIRCQQRDHAIEISVQDHGIGIPEEMRQKVFDRFFRVKGAGLQTFPGLGLGLYISFGIVQRHNGTMRVESKIGEGSTFYFSIPVHAGN